jgi:DNA-binding GntR family transcriptional regulator
MIESLWLQLGPFHRVATRYVGDNYTVDRHKEILAALRARDPIAVSMAIEADIRDGVGRLGREALRKILGDTQGIVAA